MQALLGDVCCDVEVCIFVLIDWNNYNTAEINSNPPKCPSALPSYTYTPFTLALLIRSETGFAPMRAFTLHQLIRINDLIRIKLNHLLDVVSHRFSLLLVLIASVDATRTRIKAEQICRNQCQMLQGSNLSRSRRPGASKNEVRDSRML